MKNIIPISIKDKTYNSSDYFSVVMVYVVSYGAFLGVDVLLFNFLVYRKANYRRIISFKISNYHSN
jgi:hypothetical protein